MFYPSHMFQKRLLRFLLAALLSFGIIGAFASTPMFGKVPTGKAKCVDNKVMFEVEHHFFWVGCYLAWDDTGFGCA